VETKWLPRCRLRSKTLSLWRGDRESIVAVITSTTIDPNSKSMSGRVQGRRQFEATDDSGAARGGRTKLASARAQHVKLAPRRSSERSTGR
jgi:hypothetical protein